MYAIRSYYDGRQGGRQIGLNGSGQQGQLWETVATLFSGDKLTLSANHVFRSQRQLLNGPAILVEIPEVSATQLDWTGQQPGVFETRIIDCYHSEGAILRRWLAFPQDQLIPELGPEFKSKMLPGFDRITSYNVCYTKLLRGS